MKNSKYSKKAKSFLDGLQQYKDGGMQIPLPQYQMAGLTGPNGQPIDLINYTPPILGPTMPIGQQAPMQMLQPRTPIAPLQPLASLPFNPVQSLNQEQSKLPDITVKDPTPKPNFNAIPVIGSAITLGMGIKEGVESYQAKKRADRLRGYFDQDLAERKKDISLGEYVNTPYSQYQDGGIQLGERVSNFRATDSSQSGTTTGATKMEQAKLSAAQKVENQRILAERKARMERSKAAKGKPLSAQQIADESAAIGDKFRVFPDDPNSVVDALNPLVMIGDMASGIGQVPLNIQEGNYGQAAMNVSMPLLAGALAGGKNAAQLANNLANPIAGSNVSADPTTDGIRMGIKDVLKGRPLFETFPLTKSQKEKIIKKQNEEYNKAIDFTNNWFYQYEGVLRPEVRERIVNINPENEVYLSSRHYEPMKQTENILFEFNDEEISKFPKYVQDYIRDREYQRGVNFGSGESLTYRNLGPYFRTPMDVAGTGAHELMHSSQRIGVPFNDLATSYKWSSKISKYDPELNYFTSNESTELGKRFKNALVNPEKIDKDYSYNTWLSSPTELHSELGRARYKYAKNKNLKPYEMQNMSDSQVKDLIENYDLDKHFKKETPLKEKIELIKLLPAITGAAAVGASQEMKEGGIYIDPKNKGKFTAAAKRRGMGVQEFANKVMANKKDYSPLLVKRANFAKNAAKWEDGGMYSSVSSDYNTTVELANQRKEQAMELLQKMEEVVQLHKMMYGGEMEEFKSGGEMIKRADGSYSRRGLWDNIRDNRGSGKKPTKEMLKQERKIRSEEMEYGGEYQVGGLSPRSFIASDTPSRQYSKPINYAKEEVDSKLENFIELIDPTGIHSIDDVMRSYNKTGLSFDTFLEAIGAVPMLGKLGKVGKSFEVLSKIDNAKDIIKDEEFKKNKEEMEYGGYMPFMDAMDENNQYMDLPEFGNGGYKVERSSDRKGKTHKVTGPDGSVKYFGDPNMGERSKSKYGKEAFYARHKSNLEKNPHFRAYARATWQNGGQVGLEGFGQMYDNQQAYNQNTQRQFEEYYNNLNQQNVANWRNMKTSAINNIVSGVGGLATAAVGMQNGGEYDPTLDVNSTQFDANAFLGREEGQPSELDALIQAEQARQMQRSETEMELMNFINEGADTGEANYSNLGMFANNSSSSSSSSSLAGAGEFANIIDEIKYRESRGNYGRVNDVSKTTGAYQFMPIWWADQIQDFMGIDPSASQEEVMEAFRTNPQAQDAFMVHVVNNIYKPQLPKLRPYAQKYGLNDDQLIKLMHYRGIGDATKRLKTGDFAVSEKEKKIYNNPDVMEYLKGPLPK